MNIQTVATNLRATIAGKEMLLETYKNPSILTKPIRETMAHMLEININELKRILQDIEQCIPKSECSLDGPMIKMFRED
jgi:hypothetical protein